MHNEFDGKLRFGSFDLDVGNCQLSRYGAGVPLQQQPCKLLSYLALHPKEIVSREQLRQQLWSSKTFVDFEAGLNFCISQIRRALDEDARRPKLLETLHRRGYRFIGDVERVYSEPPPPLDCPHFRCITIAISSDLEDGPVVMRLAEGIADLLLSCLHDGHRMPVVCSALPGHSIDSALSISRAVQTPPVWAEVRVSHGSKDVRRLHVADQQSSLGAGR